MFETVDYKLIAGLSAVVIIVAATVPYVIDTLKGRTQPHMYTYLIWLLTQGTAAFVLLEGGGGTAAAISLFGGIAVVGTVFLLSFWYGTKNITRSDSLALLAALVMVLVWWQLENPLLAVIMASLIDGIGYFPTYRKSFEEPWTETMVFWVASAITSVLALIAVAEYNVLTTLYLITILILNTGMPLWLLWRRRSVPVPQTTPPQT